MCSARLDKSIRKPFEQCGAVGDGGKQARRRRFDQDESARSVGMSGGREQRRVGTRRVGDDVRARQPERLEQRGQVVAVQIGRQVLRPCVTYRVGEMVSPTVGDRAVAFSERWQVVGPQPVVLQSTVHQHDWIAVTSGDIGQRRARHVDQALLRRGGRDGSSEHGRHDACRPRTTTDRRHGHGDVSSHFAPQASCVPAGRKLSGYPVTYARLRTAQSGRRSRQQAEQSVDHDSAKQAESEQFRERIGAKQFQHGKPRSNGNTNFRRQHSGIQLALAIGAPLAPILGRDIILSPRREAQCASRLVPF